MDYSNSTLLTFRNCRVKKGFAGISGKISCFVVQSDALEPGLDLDGVPLTGKSFLPSSIPPTSAAMSR